MLENKSSNKKGFFKPFFILTIYNHLATILNPAGTASENVTT